VVDLRWLLFLDNYLDVFIDMYGGYNGPWYAPGAAVSSLVHSIACDQHKIFPCSTLLNGEYGLTDICLGVPSAICLDF
jgi:malate/lactate dehydrogenase